MKVWKKSVICIMLLVILLHMLSFTVFAASYPNEFPSNKTGLTGGCFIIAHVGNTEVTIVLPVSYRDKCFTFATNGELFNITNSTIQGRLYYNNELYTVRWQSWSTAEFYRPVGTYYQWTAITIANVTDTNVIFDTNNQDWANDAIYLDKKDILVTSIQFSILFFVFLGWFMWHRSLKY